MFKKIISAFLSMIMTVGTPVFADASKPQITVTPSLSIKLNGNGIEFKSNPIIDENNRTLVAARDLAEALGKKVYWMADTETVSISPNESAGKDCVWFTIGENRYRIDGKYFDMDTCARIINDRTYIPLRVLCEALGCDVQYVTEDAASIENDGDIVVLYTNDIHCAVDSGIGYAGLASYRDKMIKEGNDVALVDVGDAIQGQLIGMISRGEYIIDIMNMLKYDVAVPGNHEFDYGMQRFIDLTEKASFPYVSCNFIDLKTNKPVFEPYTMLSLGDKKVAFVGISTPATITSSTPKFFKDENGKFIYDFCGDETGELLYNTVQKAVDDARSSGADYVIALGHNGIMNMPWTSSEIVTNTTGIDAFLDGHSHTVFECEKVSNKDGKEVSISQTGTNFENIGKLTISKNGDIKTELINDYKEKDSKIDEHINTTIATIDSLLAEDIGTTEFDLVINEPNSEPPARIVRNHETNLGDLCADALKNSTDSDVGIINSGSIRATIEKGKITKKDLYTCFPFENYACVAEATGRQLLDALEFNTRKLPLENGGFLQVSGITFTVDTSIESSVLCDDNGMLKSIDGEYRVSDVKINGKPLELDKTYKVASNEYVLLKNGDGLTAFDGCKILYLSESLLCETMCNYIKNNLKGIVGDEYSNPYGSGRIIIK